MTAGRLHFGGQALQQLQRYICYRKLAANLVKESRNVQIQYIEAAGVSDPCDLPTNIILHITNMHGLPIIHSHRLYGHCHLPCVQLKSFDQHGRERI